MFTVLFHFTVYLYMLPGLNVDSFGETDAMRGGGGGGESFVGGA